ncbi:MAG TPA: hypothetical protein ENI48_07080 [Thioploca sp.]|nr:hypothetical protein [Thioploca sp.]
MNTAHLALEQTPPLSVPLRFFLTAPLFGLLAGLLLLYDGPLFFSNRWSPETLALTHLLTLGFITMVMFGAMLQLLPILVASPVPKPILVSTVLHILLRLGSLTLAAGFLTAEQTLLMRSAIVLLGLAFFGFIGVVGYCLVRVKGRSPIITAMRLAVSALTITAVLGLGLAMLFGYGIALPLPLALTDIHLTWGLIGWVGLLVMGVSYQVVPMFQITPHYPPSLASWLTLFIFIMLLLWTPLYFLVNFSQLLTTVPHLLIGLIGLGLSVFAIATLRLQARRLRKLPDVTLNYWRVGMIGLLLSVVLWLVGVFWQNLAAKPFYPVLLGVLFLGGFVLPVIQGMLYKIVPFLVWLHLQNQQLNVLKTLKMVKTPNMKQIIPDKQTRRQFWVYFVALGFSIGAALWPSGLSHAAGGVLIVSFLWLGYNLYRALWLYQSISRKIATNKNRTA